MLSVLSMTPRDRERLLVVAVSEENAELVAQITGIPASTFVPNASDLQTYQAGFHHMMPLAEYLRQLAGIHEKSAAAKL